MPWACSGVNEKLCLTHGERIHLYYGNSLLSLSSVRKFQYFSLAKSSGIPRVDFWLARNIRLHLNKIPSLYKMYLFIDFSGCSTLNYSELLYTLNSKSQNKTPTIESGGGNNDQLSYTHTDKIDYSVPQSF